METKGVFLHREYIDLLDGDILAALMLSQIVYWYLPSKKTGLSKLRVYRNKNWWVAKSHEQWSEELGMSRQQSRRCLEVLKQFGMIETGKFLFDGHPVIHVRLPFAKGKSRLSTPPNREELQQILVANGPSENFDCAKTTNPKSKNSHSITETTTETTADRSGDLQIARAGEDPDPGEREKTDPEWGDRRRRDHLSLVRPDGRRAEDHMKAEEILRLREEQAQGKGSLATLWLRRMAVVLGGFQKPLTQKEIGQLKLISKGLGERTREVIDTVINDWPKFAARVAGEYGCSTPSQPNIGFLLKYYASAVNMIDEKVETPLVVAPETPSIPTVEEDVKTFTPEEMQKLISGLE